MVEHSPSAQRGPASLAAALLALAVGTVAPALAGAGHVQEAVERAADVVREAGTLHGRLSSGLRAGEVEERLLAAVLDIRTHAGGFRSRLLAPDPDAEALGRDLDEIERARRTAEGAIARFGSDALSRDWARLATAVDRLMAVAGAGAGAGAATGASAAAAGGRAAAVTRISLIGLEDLRLAGADVAAGAGRVAGLVRRSSGNDPARREALDALGRLAAQADRVAAASSLEEVDPAARGMSSLITRADRALSRLAAYAQVRPEWNDARKVALGIHRFGRRPR
jgi:hypothetical protein